MPCARAVLALVTAATAVALASAAAPAISASPRTCRAPSAPRAYSDRVGRALLAGRDVWGDRLLAQPGGPTYRSASRYLAPLLYASGPSGRPLTASGVYYLPFAFPIGDYGPRGFALHVADGSEIITRRVGGRSLRISVGADGSEPFGSCPARLATPRLASGYLPILELAYSDARHVHYHQESFAGRLPGSTALVSFVHVQVDALADSAVVRLTPSVRGLGQVGDRLAAGGRTYLAFSAGGRFDGRAVRFLAPRGRHMDVYAAWLNDPKTLLGVQMDAASYETARERVIRLWQSRLADGTTFAVPEPRVLDAERALLVQELAMTWRYSVGNTYEELSYAEAQDVAQVMAGYGFEGVAKAILRFSLRRLELRFTDWRAGERLLAGAAYDRLSGDHAYVAEETPQLAHALGVLERQLEDSPSGGRLLAREPYSSDIADTVYGLHGQTVVWEGLLAMGRVWAQTGHPALAARCRSLAAHLERGLRRAVADSERRLSDGSLFVPAALLAGQEPFDRLTISRDGSYWNLVAPYALASGFFQPRGEQAEGLWRYMASHGSRLLGLVRAASHRLYGVWSTAVSGTDEVYGINASRFLADEDEPDQLVLTLYGILAAGMTPGTFVSGESATVAPLRGALYRTMFLPPNAAANATFLETLRLMLVHERRGPKGAPVGLDLAFATPRAWLARGRRIAVSEAPTSFGPVSYSIRRAGRFLRADVVPPPRLGRAPLRLRLRLPAGERLVAVRENGHRVLVDSASTIRLRGRGALHVVAAVAAATDG